MVGKKGSKKRGRSCYIIILVHQKIQNFAGLFRVVLRYKKKKNFKSAKSKIFRKLLWLLKPDDGVVLELIFPTMH